MCRFLLYKSKQPTNIYGILSAFSQMAQKSRAYDGDKQEDGWGISYLVNDAWQNHKSINPIWEDVNIFKQFPDSTIFTIHARSASFPQHKNNIDYNQPFISEEYSYVFNGLLKGVTLSIPGEIGAQKIWTLLQGYLKTNDLKNSLKKTVDIIKENSRTIQALNIGVANKDTISAYSFFSEHPDYYSLHYMDNPATKLICSEPINGFDFKSLPNDSSIIL